MNKPSSVWRRSIRLHLLVGVSAAALLIVGGGAWAATTELAGAIIANGELSVASNVKSVQHPTGGVIAAINVHEGDAVTAGEVLIRLDDTTAKASLAVAVRSLQQYEAREARLEAEREGADSITFPADLMEKASDPDVASQMAGEAKLFQLRLDARNGQKAQLSDAVDQLNAEIAGDQEQIDARQKQIDLDNTDLGRLQPALTKGLALSQQVTDLQRAVASLQGEVGGLQSEIAQARGKIAQTKLQIIQVDQDARSEVASDLRDTQYQITQLTEKEIAAQDELSKIDIRAPQNGRVNQLSVHTVGGVAAPGETLMQIVPVDDALTVEFHIAPTDIDQVALGQKAFLRFSAFDERTTPEVTGTVSLVSADLTVDQRTGASYYTGRITPDPEQLAKLDKLKLTPGMPVEAFIETQERTALNYVVKPLSDQVMRAFRTE